MNQFTQPYGEVKRTAEEKKPLLVVLLEPRDVLSRDQIDVLALKANAQIGHTIFRITSSGDYEGWYIPTTGKHADPLPDGRHFQAAPAVLIAPDQSLLSVFALGQDGYVYQTWQERETDSDEWRNWSPWAVLPQTVKFKGGLAAINSPDGNLASVFTLGQDDHIYQIVYSRGSGGGWGNWTRLPGTQQLKSPPAAMNSPDGELASVFALGPDDGIYQIIYSRKPGGGWGNWIRLPGTQQFKSAPAVMNSPDGSLASVFALGQDDYIYQIAYSRKPGGGWGTWTKLPGTQQFKSAPAVMNSPDGELASVFALGNDDRIYRIVYTRKPGGGWGNWAQIPGGEQFASAPAVTPRPLHRRSRKRLRQLLFGQSDSVRSYFTEISYGQFTFKEAYTTPWLTAQDDPATPNRDESSYDFIHAGGPQIEVEKGKWVIKQVEKMTPFRFVNFDQAHPPQQPDGKVTQDELSVAWLYTGGRVGSGRERGVPLVKVPSLSVGVDIGALARGEHHCDVALMAHELGHEALYLDDLYTAMRVVRVAIAGSNDHVYVWFDDSTVCAGTSRDLDRYQEHQACVYPSGKAPQGVVGIGIAGSNDHVYVWYMDGTVSSGTSRDLAHYRKPETYSLASGKLPADIVDVAIARNDHVYVWYKDGTVSAGTSKDLDSHSLPQPYTLPAGKTPQDISGIGIAGSNDHVYVWYTDGTVSSGTPYDLDCYRAPAVYNLPPEAHPSPGRLSLMANQGNGSHISHLDPWSKMKLGWLVPKVVTQSGWYTLNDIETHPEAYILHDPVHGQHEYFIVENRWPGSSSEAGLGRGGLAIWHIHERRPWKRDYWGRKTIHLLKPRGLAASDVDSLWDGSDPRRSYDLTPDSLPANTRWDDESSSRISIKGIPVAGPQMKVYFEVP